MVDHVRQSILPAQSWANMAGRRNKKRFYICSEVIDSITDANSGCLGRGLGWFRCGLIVVWGVSTDPDRSYHFTKKYFLFEVNLPFIG